MSLKKFVPPTWNTAGIETNKCSPQWLPKCNEMDKVLVVSNHAKTF